VSDIAEVQDGQVLPVGQEEIAGVGIGVINAVAEHHLEVDVGGAADEVVDVPARRDDAVAPSHFVPVSSDMVKTLVEQSSG
jgi:hypothetical protein